MLVGFSISLNVQGLGGDEKRRFVKETIKKANPEVVLLQESKYSASREKEFFSFASSLHMSFEFVAAVGAAGGLISMWKASTVMVEDVVEDEIFIGLREKFGRED